MEYMYDISVPKITWEHIRVWEWQCITDVFGEVLVSWMCAINDRNALPLQSLQWSSGCTGSTLSVIEIGVSAHSPHSPFTILSEEWSRLTRRRPQVRPTPNDWCISCCRPEGTKKIIVCPKSYRWCDAG